VIVENDGTAIVISHVGVQGPPGATGKTDVTTELVGVQWGTPSAESSNAIDITATIKDLNSDDLDTDIVDVEILVSDGAVDYEPSATATLTSAGSPVGTVLAGDGTPRLTIRSEAGAFAVRVSEAGAGHRFLWLKGSGNARLWVRSLTGVLEIVFT
jgi:hypothetical protein